MQESIETFACFGGVVTVIVMGSGAAGSPAAAATMVKRRMLDWHSQFSRFDHGSELSTLNADPRPEVPVSPVMARLIEASLVAAGASGGLVDPTLVDEIERAGYAQSFDGRSLELSRTLELAPPRAPATPAASRRWQAVVLDRRAGTVRRPPGLRLDSGGIAKGLFGDLLADLLETHASFAIDCSGDVRLGGYAALPRPVAVAGPFTEEILDTLPLASGAIATSGIGKRSWLTPENRPAHHLLDPATGLPAFTGLVQVTAIAPTGVEAEWRAKAALLSGSDGAAEWLPHGGLAVSDDGILKLFAPRR